MTNKENLGSLYILLKADTSQYTATMVAAQKGMQAFQKSLLRSSRRSSTGWKKNMMSISRATLSMSRIVVRAVRKISRSLRSLISLSLKVVKGFMRIGRAALRWVGLPVSAALAFSVKAFSDF